MQLKFTRSKFEKGMLTKKNFYRLDVMLHLTPAEQALFAKYGLLDMSLFLAVEGGIEQDNTVLSDFLLGTKIQNLVGGASVEDATMNTPLRAETMVIEACDWIRVFAETAETFDGGTRVVELTDEKPAIVARG